MMEIFLAYLVFSLFFQAVFLAMGWPLWFGYYLYKWTGWESFNFIRIPVKDILKLMCVVQITISFLFLIYLALGIGRNT